MPADSNYQAQAGGGGWLFCRQCVHWVGQRRLVEDRNATKFRPRRYRCLACALETVSKSLLSLTAPAAGG